LPHLDRDSFRKTWPQQTFLATVSTPCLPQGTLMEREQNSNASALKVSFRLDLRRKAKLAS
jgi:hypothetical protein